MQRIPDSPPHISPLDQNVQRVLWSVMIPTYNCSDYLIEALESVLLQDQGADKMQIEVVDDCSTDANVEEIVQRIGKGRVSFYRQEKNSGSLRNFETCINRAVGYYVHLLHGDDKLYPDFYITMESLFTKFPEVSAAVCRYTYINEKGHLTRPFSKISENECIIPNSLQRLTKQQLTQYVSITVKREVYEKLGGFYGVVYGEDWIMWARIAKEYSIAYTPKILAQYREHQTSISGTGFINGNNLRDMQKVALAVSQCFPEKQQKKAERELIENYVQWLLSTTYILWNNTRNFQIIQSHLKQILKVTSSFKTIRIVGKLWVSIKFERPKLTVKKILKPFLKPKN